MLGCRQVSVGTGAGCPRRSSLYIPKIRSSLRPKSTSLKNQSIRYLARTRFYRIQVEASSDNWQQGPISPKPQNEIPALARITARILVAVPVAAAILGLNPPSASAASPTQQRTGVAAVIDESTGMPQRWVYSAGSWTQREYSKIYEFYTKPRVAGPARKATAMSRLAPQQAAAPKEQEQQQPQRPKSVVQPKADSKNIAIALSAQPSVAPVHAITPSAAKSMLETTSTKPAAPTAGPTLPSPQKLIKTASAGAAAAYTTISTQSAEQASRVLAHAEAVRQLIGQIVVSQVAAFQQAAVDASVLIKGAIEKAVSQQAILFHAASEKLATTKTAVETAITQKIADVKAAQQKSAEERSIRQKIAEEKAMEERAARTKAAEERAAELKAAQARAAEDLAAQLRAAEERAAELRAAQLKAAGVKAAQEKASAALEIITLQIEPEAVPSVEVPEISAVPLAVATTTPSSSDTAAAEHSTFTHSEIAEKASKVAAAAAAAAVAATAVPVAVSKQVVAAAGAAAKTAAAGSVVIGQRLGAAAAAAGATATSTAAAAVNTAGTASVAVAQKLSAAAAAAGTTAAAAATATGNTASTVATAIGTAAAGAANVAATTASAAVDTAGNASVVVAQKLSAAAAATGSTAANVATVVGTAAAGAASATATTASGLATTLGSTTAAAATTVASTASSVATAVSNTTAAAATTLATTASRVASKVATTATAAVHTAGSASVAAGQQVASAASTAATAAAAAPANLAAWIQANAASPPMRAVAIAAGLVATAYLLGLAWRKAIALRGESVEAIDMEIIGAEKLVPESSNSYTEGEEGSAEADLWKAGQKVAPEEVEAVAGARPWEAQPVQIIPARSRDELLADSQRRIEAAKEAVAKAERQKAAAAAAAVAVAAEQRAAEEREKEEAAAAAAAAAAIEEQEEEVAVVAAAEQEVPENLAKEEVEQIVEAILAEAEVEAEAEETTAVEVVEEEEEVTPAQPEAVVVEEEPVVAATAEAQEEEEAVVSYAEETPNGGTSLKQWADKFLRKQGEEASAAAAAELASATAAEVEAASTAEEPELVTLSERSSNSPTFKSLIAAGVDAAIEAQKTQQPAPPQPPRATTPDPVSEFVSALDGKNPATPLLAVLGVTSALVSGVIDVIDIVANVGVPSSKKGSSKKSELSPWDLLLAPAALLSGLSDGRTVNKYDLVLDVLRSALDTPAGVAGGEKYSPIREMLDAAPPRPGTARYDFVRNLIRGLADGQDAPDTGLPYDMIRDLIHSAAAAEDPESKAVADRFCAVHDLLHKASLVEDWGPKSTKYDPLNGVVGTLASSEWELSDWAGANKYCPITSILKASPPPPVASKYDPITSSLKGAATWKSPARDIATTPLRTERYDPLASLFSTLMTADPGPRRGAPVAVWDPVAVALDAAAGWNPPSAKRDPTGSDKYDVIANVLDNIDVPKSGSGSDLWDPMHYLLNGWAAEWDSTSKRPVRPMYDPVGGILKGAAAPTVKSKYDMLQGIIESKAPEKVAETTAWIERLAPWANKNKSATKKKGGGMRNGSVWGSNDDDEDSNGGSASRSSSSAAAAVSGRAKN